jgi:hypothetical protein
MNTTNRISLSLVNNSDSGKNKFTPTEEKTAKGILLRVGLLAQTITEDNLSPTDIALITPIIQASVQTSLDNGASKFPQIVREAYQAIEKTNFERSTEEGVTYETALDRANWPIKRCHAALNGMLRRIAIESKVLTKELAESFWSSYTAKKVVRR